MMRKYKILFEASPMVDSLKTGVGYYVDRLINTIDASDDKSLDITGYYFDFLGKNNKKAPKAKAIRYRRIRMMPGKVISIFRKFGIQPSINLFLLRKFDIYIFTNYVSLPTPRGSAVVLAIYDLGFLDAPDYVQEKNLHFLRRFSPKSIEQADCIITISEFTKERIKRHFPELEAKIIVTPIPPPELPSKQDLNNRLLKLNINKGKYLLYLGTVEPRKNIDTLVRAYSSLDSKLQEEYPLVLAGGKGWKDEFIQLEIANARARGSNIITTGYVTDEEKASLYDGATAFVLASHYEGFGMPILEAIQYDKPIALSDLQVFHEVAGNAAVYFDKDNPTDISEKLSWLLTDESLRKKLQKNGKRQLAKYSWADISKDVIRELKNLKSINNRN